VARRPEPPVRRRCLVAAAVGLLGLLALLVVRAASMTSRQPDAAPVGPARVDADGAIERLRAGLRIRTISPQDGIDRDVAAFRDFRRHLAAAYPLVHARLERELVGDLSLLFRWPGRDPDAPALVLLAHQDVVPIDPGTEGDWTHPPFAAELADGYVWGRGSLDDKASLFAVLEAVESLLAAGFGPAADVYLAFGHDEELGGGEGAALIAALLAERAVRVGLVLDEGGVIFEGSVPGLRAPVAAVGVAEKGYLSVVLEVEGEGGHSSAPPPITAIGRVSAAVLRVESSPLPSRLGVAARAFLERGIGPESPFAHRLVYANLWLFDPLVRAVLGRVPGASAMIRTTAAPTIFRAGQKDNVLPARARAVVNFRVLPGDTTEGVIEHVRRTVDDEQVRISALPKRREPSSASALDGPAWVALGRSIREVFPEVVVAPYLLVAGTDSRHFRELCDCVYQFMPFRVTPADMTRAHGTNERVSAGQVVDAVRFYRRLIENAAGK